MPDLALRINVTGADFVEEFLLEKQARLEDLSPAFRHIADEIREHVEKVFASEGGETQQGRWATLSTAYGRWKEQHYPGCPILTRTEVLRKSFQDGENHIEDVMPNSLVFGSDVPYGVFHQEGRGHNPVRAILDPPDAEVARWVALFQQYLDQELVA